MLKNILIGLDGTDDSRAALELGLRWAARFQATILGIGVVDKPGIETIEASAFAGRATPLATDSALSDATLRLGEVLRDFTRRCDAANVPCRSMLSVGRPHARILEEAWGADLILLGSRTHFEYGGAARSDATLARVIRQAPRPVVAVPGAPAAGDPVVVAYDGSPQSSRALQAFEATGLGRPGPVHVVGVAGGGGEMARQVDQAVEFLRHHDVDALPHMVESPGPPAAAILGEVRRSGAGLLVMGAYGRSVVREVFLGSVTRTVLEESPVPVFCSH